jgi:hypothetical protein
MPLGGLLVEDRAQGTHSLCAHIGTFDVDI